MRTTIPLKDELGAVARRRAAEEGLSLSAYIARLLVDALARGPKQPRPPPFRLIVAGGGGPYPGIDLDRASQLLVDEDAAQYPAEDVAPMRMPDVNVLIYAHRQDAHSEHEEYGRWLTSLALGPEPFALSSLVLSGLVRIVTNRRIFRRPSTLDEVFGFIHQLRVRPGARLLTPGPRHWDIFEDLCRGSNASGKLAADAYHAALAIEHGCVWVTTDGDFLRFPALRSQHPFEKAG